VTTAKRPGPLNAAATLALTATTLATALTFCRVFPDWSFLGPFVVVAVSVHAVSAAARWWRWGVLPAVVAGLGTLAVVLGVLFYRDTLFGVLPTRATWDAAWQELADSFSLFRTTVAPVPSDGGFAVAVALGIGLSAVLADAFAFRAYGRLEALVPSALLFVTASALGTDRYRLPTAALWLSGAVLTVALLRAAHSESATAWLGGGSRSRTTAVIGGAITLAVVATIAGTVIGPRLPGAEAEALIDTRNRASSGTEVVSPLVDIQARLVNRSNTELFTVTTGAQSYWRLTTLPEFDGRQFRAPEREYIDTDSLRSDLPESETVRQQIRIASLGSVWVPAAADVIDVTSTEPLLYDGESGSVIRERGNLFPGLGYSVTSVLPRFSVEQLRGATTDDPPGDVHLALPADFNDDLQALAATATAGATTPYDRALALQNYFRTQFRYNVNVSRGHSIRSIESFINAGEGYCEQFSVAFAALARTLGLPTRVAVGFTPGDRDATGVWHVRGKHAHAWPEVWFDGVGWVPFEPTPGRGVPGAEAYTGIPAQQEGGILTGEADPATNTGGAEQPPVPQTAQPTVPTLPIEGPLSSTGPGGALGTSGDETGSAGTSMPWRGILVVLGVLALWTLLMPPIARAAARWSARRLASPADEVVAGWRRATIALGLVGARRRLSETPSEHAARAWRMTGIDEKSLRDLARRATVATYAADHVDAQDAATATALARRIGRLVLRRAPRGVRLLARLDPRRAAVLG
jgi:transglutaminase-like putative cysteine protease